MAFVDPDDITFVDPDAEQEQEPKKELSYMDKLEAAYDKRVGEVATTFKDYANDDIGLGSAALQTVGKGGFGGLADVAGETVGTVLSAVTPDVIEEPVKQYVGETFKRLMSTDGAQAIMEQWDSLDPETRKNVESFANIAAIAAPKVKLGKFGDKAKLKYNKGVSKLIAEPDTQGNRVAAALREMKDLPKHIEMTDTISKIKGVNPKKSPLHNIKAVNKSMAETETFLRNRLTSANVKVPKGLAEKQLNKNLKELWDDGLFLKSAKSEQKAFNDAITEARAILKKTDGTAVGLLDARRQFDKRMKKFINNSSTDVKPAMDQATLTIRRTLNEVVDASAKNTDVTGMLKKQHHIYLATKNMAEKAAKHKSGAQKLWAMAKAHPYIAASPFIGGGMASGLGAPLAAAGGAMAAAYGLSKLPVGKGLGMLGKLTDKVPVSATRTGLFYGNEEEQK